jgi:rhodanese-related sulfurtransferase
MKKILVFGIIALFIGLAFIPSFNAVSISKSEDMSINVGSQSFTIINITVDEAWELLNDTSNGIQTPIDIRDDEEWSESFIDTPYPENAVHYPLDWFKNASTLQIFLDLYEGKEIVPYGKGGYRLLIMLYLLCEANYTGIIYCWGGGITSWIEEGYPIRNNTAPERPHIWHEHSKGKATIGFTKEYHFKTEDPDGDNIWLYIDWGDGYTEGWIGPYKSGKEVIINHTYEWEGTYGVRAKAKDIFGVEGEWGEEMIPISDCLECQSNGKTYLVEKIFNRSEKDGLVLNVIKLDTQGDRPICVILNKTISRLDNLLDSLLNLLDTVSEDTILWHIYTFQIYILAMGILPTIETYAEILNCW